MDDTASLSSDTPNIQRDIRLIARDDGDGPGGNSPSKSTEGASKRSSKRTSKLGRTGASKEAGHGRDGQPLPGELVEVDEEVPNNSGQQIEYSSVELRQKKFVFYSLFGLKTHAAYWSEDKMVRLQIYDEHGCPFSVTRLVSETELRGRGLSGPKLYFPESNGIPSPSRRPSRSGAPGRGSSRPQLYFPESEQESGIPLAGAGPPSASAHSSAPSQRADELLTTSGGQQPAEQVVPPLEQGPPLTSEQDVGTTYVSTQEPSPRKPVAEITEVSPAPVAEITEEALAALPEPVAPSTDWNNMSYAGPDWNYGAAYGTIPYASRPDVVAGRSTTLFDYQLGVVEKLFYDDAGGILFVSRLDHFGLLEVLDPDTKEPLLTLRIDPVSGKVLERWSGRTADSRETTWSSTVVSGQVRLVILHQLIQQMIKDCSKSERAASLALGDVGKKGIPTFFSAGGSGIFSLPEAGVSVEGAALAASAKSGSKQTAALAKTNKYDSLLRLSQLALRDPSVWGRLPRGLVAESENVKNWRSVLVAWTKALFAKQNLGVADRRDRQRRLKRRRLITTIENGEETVRRLVRYARLPSNRSDPVEISIFGPDRSLLALWRFDASSGALVSFSSSSEEEVLDMKLSRTPTAQRRSSVIKKSDEPSVREQARQLSVDDRRTRARATLVAGMILLFSLLGRKCLYVFY